MDNNRSIELKVGIVSFLGLCLLIGAILFGRGTTIGNQAQVVMLFPSSGGIEPSAPVTIAGVKRGTVTSVENVNGAVRIVASLNRIDDVKSDATAKILMLEITGGKKIEIMPGTAPTPYTGSMTLRGETAVDVAELVAMVGDVAQSAKSTIMRLDTITAVLTDVMGDPKFSSSIKSTVQNLSEIAQSGNDLLKTNRAVLQRTLTNLDAITADVRLMARANGPVDSLITSLTALSGNANTFVRSLDTTRKNADIALEQVQTLLNDVRRTKGFANRMIYDDMLAARLDSALTDIHFLVKFINANGVNVNLRLGTRP
jgi:ABC-type transporter Mla subunit MlaD